MDRAIHIGTALLAVFALASCAAPTHLLNTDGWFDHEVLDAASQGSVCAAQVIELDKVIEEHRQCESTSDCVSQFVGVCPFACYTAVNEKGAKELLGQLKQFEGDCHICGYECNEATFAVECRAKRCELTGQL